VTDRQLLKETLKMLIKQDCTFWACEGSAKDRVEDMKTCSICWQAHLIREHLKNTSAKGRKRKAA
jgi:hypothetical protein